MKQTTNNKLLYLSPEVLLTHPKNLRRFYPENQVREMAESIKAAGGVHQALLIVPNGKAGRYFVVDGNMRLAGGRHLGKDCPKLKCELVDQTTAGQLLTMAATAKFRYDPDPISEALHYQRLMEEEGYNVPQLGRALGISPTQLYQQLKLLKLDKEIQGLIGTRKLPRDARAVDALLSVPDAKARVKLAERMAAMEAGIKAIVAACTRLNEQMKEAAQQPPATGTPAIDLARQRTFGKTLAENQDVKIQKIRRSAAEVCEGCNAREAALKAYEPAWSLIAHEAGETCKACDVKAVKGACRDCPAVDFLRRIILSVQEKRGGRDHE
jgi:ParB/RepB/Spo0J family partition protein